MLPVTLLLPVYYKDNPLFFDHAIESVWSKQVIKPRELLVVVDGPINSDLSYILDKWSSLIGNYFRAIYNPINMGLAYSLNVGLRSASYEIVIRMDSDDISYPNRIMKLFEYFSEHPNIDIVGSSSDIMDDSGNIINHKSVPLDHASIFDSLWFCPLIHPSVAYKRDSILSVGGYNEQLRRRQDYELWFRCAEANLKFANISKPLIAYRFGSNTISKQTPRLSLQQSLIGYRGCLSLKLPFYRALCCFYPFFRSLLPSWFQSFLYRFRF